VKPPCTLIAFQGQDHETWPQELSPPASASHSARQQGLRRGAGRDHAAGAVRHDLIEIERVEQRLLIRRTPPHHCPSLRCTLSAQRIRQPSNSQALFRQHRSRRDDRQPSSQGQQADPEAADRPQGRGLPSSPTALAEITVRLDCQIWFYLAQGSCEIIQSE